MQKSILTQSQGTACVPFPQSVLPDVERHIGRSLHAKYTTKKSLPEIRKGVISLFVA